MNMLWNTQIEDTCIVFRSWHIQTNTAFVLSCFAILFLGVFYEWLREAQKNLDRKIAARLSAQGKGKGVRLGGAGSSGEVSGYSGEESEESGLLTGLRVSKERNGTPIPVVSRFTRASLYGFTVFLSFFLMLVFMTYNAYLILAVVLGAALGHYLFNAEMDIDSVLAGGAGAGKTMACH